MQENPERLRINIMFVSPEKQRALEEKMRKLGIFENDIEEKFIRSGGKGGQNVNKTSTCVYIKHLPTGIEVKCQQDRSQPLNRFLARRILAEKIESAVLGKQSAEQQRIEKIRRQKRKRSKRAKAKMLDDKRIHSEKKAFRAPVRHEGDY
jgi:protein subunit release factor B